ncbi:hypothetical protein P7K49_004244 [Saguinus oedipus]|uniref:Cytosolic arginine sensor for mTORC1 subunit 2 n=1 Tax=Saguinus oedipus TaxID=9490 RepID=A0ABQ9W6W5_SAGOE|nr:hypothetical protein P7K49_004244 [Saguinus oedipus]
MDSLGCGHHGDQNWAELPSSEHLSVADATWLALNVVSGGGSFSSSQPIGVTKIAKSVIAPLADQNISVFMLSTYQTDFILVRERDLPFVTHTLSSEFTILRVVNGETVAAENLGITNGFVKPKMVQRPVIHPLSSPSNRFCVTSLDPDTLPAVATLLMDVMFYSNGSSLRGETSYPGNTEVWRSSEDTLGAVTNSPLSTELQGQAQSVVELRTQIFHLVNDRRCIPSSVDFVKLRPTTGGAGQGRVQRAYGHPSLCPEVRADPGRGPSSLSAGVSQASSTAEHITHLCECGEIIPIALRAG